MIGHDVIASVCVASPICLAGAYCHDDCFRPPRQLPPLPLRCAAPTRACDVAAGLAEIEAAAVLAATTVTAIATGAVSLA